MVLIPIIANRLQSFSILIIFSLIILHIFHLRGPYTIPFQKLFRNSTRFEQFFMRLMFKILKSEILYKNRLIRFIPEFISWFAANGVRPTVYTLPELERIINILYAHNKHNNTANAANFGILLRPCP
ncbi:MAG: hypothetical protein ACTSYB_13360, partial [Candidatus Helarchaeota archaeon]